MRDAFLAVDRSVGDGRIVLALLGEATLATAAVLFDAILDAASHRPPAIEVDCRGLTFLDADGVEALLRARRAVQSAAPVIELYLVNVHGSVARSLDVRGLRSHLVRRPPDDEPLA